jgi:hypothetical protein
MGLVENGGGLSIADAMALAGNRNEGGLFEGTSAWVFFLFFLLAWGGGGGFFGGGGNSTREGELTRAEMYNALGQQDSFSNQSNIMRELSAFERDAANNWGSMKYDNLMGVNNIMSQMAANAAAQAQCCCETNRNIDAVRYENARNTGDVVHNAQLNTRDILESQNAGFQRILDFLTNDKIESLRNELQSAQLQLGNMSQTTTLINTLRPFPAPAYITNSPYTAIYPPVTTG